MSAGAVARLHLFRVSVLFSEPKIPQSIPAPARFTAAAGFSALQRAENSSMLAVFDDETESE